MKTAFAAAVAFISLAAPSAFAVEPANIRGEWVVSQTFCAECKILPSPGTVVDFQDDRIENPLYGNCERRPDFSDFSLISVSQALSEGRRRLTPRGQRYLKGVRRVHSGFVTCDGMNFMNFVFPSSSSAIYFLDADTAIVLVKREPAIAVSTGPVNVVAAFLGNADRQTENKDQRREIARALHDMLDATPQQLRVQLYADYQGRNAVWPITNLLKAYFVPKPPSGLEPEAFFRDVAKPEARKAVEAQLASLQAASAQDK
jgi:hypothetical protein